MAKLILTFILCLGIGICYSQSDFQWEEIKDAPTITSKNAKKVKRYKNSPESLLSYFYASKIRDDNKWTKVLPQNRSGKLEYALKEYKDWKFNKFRLVSKTKDSSGTLWVKVFFEIEYKGRVDSGEDEASLKLENGKWIIATLPS